MLTKRLRKQIEWHFYNYAADAALYEERERDILSEGLTANFNRVGSCPNRGSATESKAVRLEALGTQRTWATVVRNTFNAFRFEPEYSIMSALYIQGKPYKELFSDGLWETTFWRWREKWLEYAYKWAREYELL